MTFSLAKKVVSEAIERWDWSGNVLIGGSIGCVGVDDVQTVRSEDDALKHFSVDVSPSADNVNGGELNRFQEEKGRRFGIESVRGG